jgi:subtilisin-like proprotein convertase family protein
MAGYPRTPAATYDTDTSWDVSPVPPFDHGDFQDVGSANGTWSPWFGYGRVDATQAVQTALSASDDQTTRVRVELNPNVAIPDRDPAGIVSQVFVPDGGRIRMIKVHLDIEHTYIGDLVVRITGPVGTRADLHVRAGGSAHDLIATYDQVSAPGLGAFLGTDIKGTWILSVADHARADVGRLRRWTLEAEVQSDSVRRFESSPGIAIPDNDPIGIQDGVQVSGIGKVDEIAVEIDITHTWIGDLNVSVRNPAGVEVALHEREGRSADDIQRTYRIDEAPDLGAFLGQDGDGDWTFSVSDNAGRDVGKLNRWALLLR